MNFFTKSTAFSLIFGVISGFIPGAFAGAPAANQPVQGVPIDTPFTIPEAIRNSIGGGRSGSAAIQFLNIGRSTGGGSTTSSASAINNLARSLRKEVKIVQKGQDSMARYTIRRSDPATAGRTVDSGRIGNSRSLTAVYGQLRGAAPASILGAIGGPDGDLNRAFATSIQGQNRLEIPLQLREDRGRRAQVIHQLGSSQDPLTTRLQGYHKALTEKENKVNKLLAQIADLTQRREQAEQNGMSITSIDLLISRALKGLELTLRFIAIAQKQFYGILEGL
ncbi:MAG: hypothetical protein Q8P95_02090 [bacterium]|nr:hypothetical protein [bacterium]